MYFQKSVKLIAKCIIAIAEYRRLAWNFFQQHWFLYSFLLFIYFVGRNYYVPLPPHLQHIQPQRFDSYLPADLTLLERDLIRIKPRVFEDKLISICEDIEVNENQIVYCVNKNRQIVQLDTKSFQSKVLYRIQKGITYGLRLSKDQKLLYFVNSELGLCQLNLENNRVQQLISQYRGEFLMSLNAIEIHPQDPNIIYFTQSSTMLFLNKYHFDILFNNPFGRVFMFNKESMKLSLLAEGMYFPNGVVFQKYKGQDTLLVAETNRYRLTRIYINGIARGLKQIAVNGLNIFPDNIKARQDGSLIIGSIGTREIFSIFIDKNPWTRTVLTRLSTKVFQYVMGRQRFGGAIIKFQQDTSIHTVQYCLWKSHPNYNVSSTLYLKNDKLYVSSSLNEGVLVIDKITEKLGRKNSGQGKEKDAYLKPIEVNEFGDRFQL